MSWYKRMLFCLLGWGTVGVVYSLSDELQRTGYVLTFSALDTALGFHPEAIWLYLSFFVLIPTSFFLAAPNKVKPLVHSMQFAALASGAVFLLFPTTLTYPEYQASASIHTQLLHELIRVDSAQNLLPSLHVSLSMLAGWGVWQSNKTARNLFVWIWISLICISILLLKRHLFVDLIAGAALALVLIYSYAKKAANRGTHYE